VRNGCFVFLLAGSLAVAAVEEKKRLEIETTHSASFPAAGNILVRDSFGELLVEGWDRPEVEITVTKATRRRYSEEDQQKALEFLNSIEVAAVSGGPGRLMITTTYPDRTLLKRPFRGKTNLELIYRIRAPRTSNLVIEHDTGVVNVKDITGNLNVSSRIGEISLGVPANGNYTINARTRLGEVDTDFPGQSARRFLTDTFLNDAGAPASHIHVRLGIGSINIRKLQAAASPSRRELRASLDTTFSQ
jgi:hypothetical protein